MIDTDKLKLLSNDIQDYIVAYQEKIIQLAIKNGHEIKPFLKDIKGYKGFYGETTDISEAYCTRCGFQINMEHFHTMRGEDKVYLSGDDLNTKCPRSKKV